MNGGMNLRDKVAIYLHANAEDIFTTEYHMDFTASYLDMTIISMEYPSYSVYEGAPTSQRVTEDALYLYDFFVGMLGVCPE